MISETFQKCIHHIWQIIPACSSKVLSFSTISTFMESFWCGMSRCSGRTSRSGQSNECIANRLSASSWTLRVRRDIFPRPKKVDILTRFNWQYSLKLWPTCDIYVCSQIPEHLSIIARWWNTILESLEKSVRRPPDMSIWERYQHSVCMNQWLSRNNSHRGERYLKESIAHWLVNSIPWWFNNLISW